MTHYYITKGFAYDNKQIPHLYITLVRTDYKIDDVAKHMGDVKGILPITEGMFNQLSVIIPTVDL